MLQSMTVQVARQSRDFTELFKLERHAFAAKIRLVRAVLGWSQGELGFRIGMTQRAIHKLEQGETEPRRTTMRALEEIWRENNIEFEDLADGGFRVSVRATVLDQPLTARTRRRQSARRNLGVTAVARRAS
jgi:transcriptional regulator with XRE-family HTH domain